MGIKKDEHYRATEKRLNDFKNGRIGYTEFIDQDWYFIKEAIEKALDEITPERREFPHKKEDFEKDDDGVITEKTLRNARKALENNEVADSIIFFNQCLDQLEENKRKFLNN